MGPIKTKRRSNKIKSKERSQSIKKYRITIHPKDFSEGLYQYFKRMKLNPKHNFINFTTDIKNDKIIFSFQSRINRHYNSDPLWEDIHCKELILSDTMIVKTECVIGSFHKIFVKGFHNLHEYIQSIKKNKTDKKDHQLLFDLIFKNQLFLKNKNLINHNLDVKTLHFKFV